MVGVALLLDRLHILRFGYWTIIWGGVFVYGGVHAARGFNRGVRGQIFWGTVLFLFSLQFLLRSFELIEFKPYFFSPVTLFIVGAGFLMMYLSNYHAVHLLVPTLLCLGLGGTLLFAELGYIERYEIWPWIQRYWPAGLIVIGLALLFRHKNTSQNGG